MDIRGHFRGTPCKKNRMRWLRLRPFCSDTQGMRKVDFTPQELAEAGIAVVVPAYNCERHLVDLLARMPSFIQTIILVNDTSTDGTGLLIEALRAKDRRIVTVHHSVNQGVGGALISGFRAALTTNARIVVKVDGDGQMAPERIEALVQPLMQKRADYAKGNRFRHHSALRSMPPMRRFGNLGLSFAVKLGSGYWKMFDPCNGFVAIRSEVLRAINLERLERRYFFEISMLHQLSLVGAVVRDVSMPAFYGTEVSHLRIKRILFEFTPKLVAITLRRILYRKLGFDFSMDGLYLLAGVPLLLFGMIFGALKWYHYAAMEVPAPTGTIMVALLPFIVGIQFLIAAASLDILSEPSEPLSGRAIDAADPVEIEQDERQAS